MNRYIVFDTETPNCRNDRISAIGVAVVEHGAITEQHYALVDPETHFDAFNVNLTGITPEMVRGERNFPALWEELGPIFDSGILVAHNAVFDLGVLSKLFRAYGIARAPDRYACTVQMGRRCLPQMPNHKLNTLCALLDIPLDHHNAMSDCLACARLLLYYQDHGLPISQYIKSWDYNR